MARFFAGCVFSISTNEYDMACVGMTVIDGLVRSQRNRNTLPATRVPVVVKGWDRRGPTA